MSPYRLITRSLVHTASESQ